jgi:YfiH family protein
LNIHPAGLIRKLGMQLAIILHLKQARLLFACQGMVSQHQIWLKQADALVTRIQGYALGVFTADCLPLLLFDPVQRAVGIVHAGWRGTAKAICQKTVEKMKEVFQSRASTLLAALGPCIGPCCYEVDEPVRAAFCSGGSHGN